jgi:hypothetical protein
MNRRRCRAERAITTLGRRLAARAQFAHPQHAAAHDLSIGSRRPTISSDLGLVRGGGAVRLQLRWRRHSEVLRVRRVWPAVTGHAADTVLLGISPHGHLAVACRTSAIADELNSQADSLVDRVNELAKSRTLFGRVQAFPVSSELEAVPVNVLADSQDRIEDLSQGQ